MKITPKLKKWLVDNCDVKADATDDEFKKAAGDALIDDKLTAQEYAELTEEKDNGEANEFAKQFSQLADGIGKLTELLKPEEGAEGSYAKAKLERDEAEKKAKEAEEEASRKKSETEGQPSRTAKMLAGMGMAVEEGGKDIDWRVKEAAESYSTTKTALKYSEKTCKDSPHPFAGKEVIHRGHAMDTPSDLDQALSGVWAKFQLMAVTPRIAGTAQRAWEMLSDHEKSLLCHLVENTDWDYSKDTTREFKDTRRRGYPGLNGTPSTVKQLIDDAVSGGLEAAPIVFDDQVIQTPLLYGELYPLVNEIPLDRGRRIEGVSIDTVTGTWGGVDDSPVGLFATAAYVAAFDTTIYRWEGAIRIGLDFVSDTPIDFNTIITAQYGERLLEDLDDVIATGNGTNQPQGVMNSGATAVAFGAATNLNNYESLRFGVAEPEHRGPVKNTAVFCGTEVSYSRAIGIPVGGTDTRRVFGTEAGPNYDARSILQRPYKLNESLTNEQIFYAILGRYRMYRRKGFTVRTTTEGDTLVRRNEMLIVVMARYGGQIERPACVSLTTTAVA